MKFSIYLNRRVFVMRIISFLFFLPVLHHSADYIWICLWILEFISATLKIRYRLSVLRWSAGTYAAAKTSLVCQKRLSKTILRYAFFSAFIVSKGNLSGFIQWKHWCSLNPHNITKICLYNFDPIKPHFYIVKLGFTGVYINFLISAQNIDCGTR